MDTRCVICGAAFQAPPSAKRVTCGAPGCVRERKRRAHMGVANAWSAAARQRLAARGQTANLRLGTPAARQSPRAGPFASHHEAKIWQVIAPTGATWTVRNLRLWCQTHAEQFAPDPWEHAYAGLRQVQAWLMGKRPRTVSQWKGWTLACPAVPPDAPEPGAEP